MRLNSKQICSYTGGSFLVEPIDSTKLALGITWDSRDVQPDDVFLALSGEQVDGHTFIGDALRAGATIVLVTDRPDEQTCLLAHEMGAAIIEVSNTASALRDLARAWRKRLSGQVVGITGSSGKTTTKNLVRDVLKNSFRVIATEGNQNNELGVPKTILMADPEAEIIIVEMGMRGLGQIHELCEFVMPDRGLITNIGDGHIELLGSRKNIAKAKAELFEALPDGFGKAFINRDDEYAEYLAQVASIDERNIELIWFDGSMLREEAEDFLPDNPAVGKNNEDSIFDGWGVWAEDISLDNQGRPGFTLHIKDESVACQLQLSGVHNVANACAAASVAASFGCEITDIAKALGQSCPEAGRQEILSSRDGYTVINDAYNANPDSMRAALNTFASFTTTGKRVAVLGDMGELGSYAQACHEGVGELAAKLPIDYLICVGELSSHTAEAARQAGMDSRLVYHFDSLPEVMAELDGLVLPGDVVLVKASRFMGLERIVGGLVN